MRGMAGVFLMALGALAPGSAGAQTPAGDRLQAVVQSIEVPGGEREVLRAKARGVQIYRCELKAGKASWGAAAPEARLFVGDRVVATHGAGPMWRYEDASSVRGEMVARVNSMDLNAIPLLLIKAVDHEGNPNGLLGKVNFVQRLETNGGLAPADGCDEARAGTFTRIPYTATYVFYQPET